MIVVEVRGVRAYSVRVADDAPSSVLPPRPASTTAGRGEPLSPAERKAQRVKWGNEWGARLSQLSKQLREEGA